MKETIAKDSIPGGEVKPCADASVTESQMEEEPKLPSGYTRAEYLHLLTHNSSDSIEEFYSSVRMRSQALDKMIKDGTVTTCDGQRVILQAGGSDDDDDDVFDDILLGGCTSNSDDEDDVEGDEVDNTDSDEEGFYGDPDYEAMIAKNCVLPSVEKPLPKV